MCTHHKTFDRIPKGFQRTCHGNQGLFHQRTHENTVDSAQGKNHSLKSMSFTNPCPSDCCSFTSRLIVGPMLKRTCARTHHACTHVICSFYARKRQGLFDLLIVPDSKVSKFVRFHHGLLQLPRLGFLFASTAGSEPGPQVRRKCPNLPQRILRLREYFQQLVVGQEEKSRKVESFLLKVFVQPLWCEKKPAQCN